MPTLSSLTLALATVAVAASLVAMAADQAKPAGSLGVGAPAQATAESLVATELLADTEKIEAGKPFRIFVLFKVAPHWHIYWKNSGDSGMAPSVAFELPPGFTAGPLEFPCPSVERTQDGTDYILEGDVALATTVTPPSDADKIPASAHFDAKIGWLVCKGSCLLGKRDQSLTLSSATATPVDSRVALFVSALPKPAASIGVNAKFEKDTLVLTVPSATAQFIPASTPGVSYGKPATQTLDGHVTMRVPLTIEPQNAVDGKLVAAGAVVLDEKASPRVFTEVEVPVPKASH
jgi:thiol:disulfide interchange protein DsbD